MPAVHQPVVCGAPNAFRPYKALCQLLVVPLSLPSGRRDFSCSSVRRQEALQSTHTQENLSVRRVQSRGGSEGETIRVFASDKGPLARIAQRQAKRWGKEWRESQSRNVVPNSLEKTLEAQRASNRASVLRPVATDAGIDVYKRPDIRYSTRKDGKQAAPDDADTALEQAQAAGTTDWFEHLNRRRNPPKDPGAGTGSGRATATEDIAEVGRKRKPKGRVNPKSAKPVMEYEGQVVLPTLPTSNMTVGETELPWAVKQPQGIHPLERLTAEVKGFEAYMQPTAFEQTARDAVINELQQFVRETQPGYTLELFGSQRTGLAVATSDIDLRLCPPAEMQNDAHNEKAPHPSIRTQLKLILQRLCDALSKDPRFMLCVFRYAWYPLVSLQHAGSGLDVQIVCANDTSLSRECINKYLTEIPTLKTVYILVRSMLEIRRLTDVFRGGLGSYSLIMMIAASLRIEPISKQKDVARSLLGFLEFYGKLDTYKVAVSVEPAKFFNKRLSSLGKPKPSRRMASEVISEQLESDEDADMDLKDRIVLQGQEQLSIVDPIQPYLLCLQDPADAFNDLGRKGYAIKHIQQTIKALYQELATKLYRNHPGSVIAPLVGPSYTLFAGRRSKIELYGRSVT